MAFTTTDDLIKTDCLGRLTVSREHYEAGFYRSLDGNGNGKERDVGEKLALRQSVRSNENGGNNQKSPPGRT